VKKFHSLQLFFSKHMVYCFLEEIIASGCFSQFLVVDMCHLGCCEKPFVGKLC